MSEQDEQDEQDAAAAHQAMMVSLATLFPFLVNKDESSFARRKTTFIGVDLNLPLLRSKYHAARLHTSTFH